MLAALGSLPSPLSKNTTEKLSFGEAAGLGAT
jgi:hypothetical protein